VIDWRGQRRTFFQRSDELAEIPPTAIFWGTRDSMIPAAHGKAFAESVGGVTFELFENCGHYLHCEQPANFVRALRAFLDG
jgi:pimeloyl-ACP methyl ester carboxylesterase